MTLLTLLHSGKELHRAPGKIIKANMAQVLLDAHALQQRTEEEAAAMKKDAESQCDAIKKAAHDEGFQEGLVSLNQHILYLNEQVKSLELKMQEKIIPLVLTAVRKIIAKEIETNPQTIVAIVQKSLASTSDSPRIIIHVSKHDRPTVEAFKQQFRDRLERVESLLIQENDELSPGDCIIETTKGIINATLERQLEALTAALGRYKMT